MSSIFNSQLFKTISYFVSVYQVLNAVVALPSDILTLYSLLHCIMLVCETNRIWQNNGL